MHIDPIDYGNLPFQDSQFDLAIMNGVLEWVGAARTDKQPQACQKAVLNEIRRVLKPNGTIYIGIENRFSLRNFLGKSSHSKVPFADILPRQFANLWCKMMGKEDGYRTYIYSSLEYKKLLYQSGFENFQLLLPVPSYQNPCMIIPTQDKNVLRYYVNNSGNSARRARSIKQLARSVPQIVKFFAADYSITAKARK